MNEAPDSALGRNFWRQWASAAISTFGDGMYRAALPLLVASMTHDPVKVAGSVVAFQLPWLGLALFSGALVDRWDRQRVMLACDLANMALVGALAAAVLGHQASIWVIYVVAFGLGVVDTFFQNAVQSILPLVVRKDQLEAANSKLFAAVIGGREFIGPPAGSLVFVLATGLPFAIDSGTFLASFALVVGMRGLFRPPQAAQKVPITSAVREGIAWLWHHKLLRDLALMIASVNLALSAAGAVLVLYTLERLHLGPQGYGILLTAGAVGSLSGTFLRGRIRQRLNSGHLLNLVLALMTIAYLVIAVAPFVPLVFLTYAVASFAITIWGVVTVSLRQAIVPSHLLGRVNSVYRLVAFAATPAGALLGGILASKGGLAAPYYFAAAILAVLAVASLSLTANTRIEAARAGAAA